MKKMIFGFGLTCLLCNGICNATEQVRLGKRAQSCLQSLGEHSKNLVTSRGTLDMRVLNELKSDVTAYITREYRAIKTVGRDLFPKEQACEYLHKIMMCATPSEEDMQELGQVHESLKSTHKKIKSSLLTSRRKGDVAHVLCKTAEVISEALQQKETV